MGVSTPSRALITGGCGFIGVNLARKLVERGWSVVAYDNLSSGKISDAEAAGFSDVIVGDVRDGPSLTAAAAGFDYVVHLAAHTNVVESVEDPVHDVEENVLGTLNALVAARDAKVAGFVFASSNAPLGDIEPPSHEEKVPKPSSPYGASKLAGEALCSAFAGSYGLPTSVLRFSNVYGPYSYHKGSVVAAWMKMALDGDPLIIYGDGSQTRDFVHVTDLCEGIAKALESGLQGEVFHLGSGVETSVKALAEMVQQQYGDLEIVYKPVRAGEIMRNYSDISKARRMLGFDPAMALEDGLVSTKAWFAEEYS